jgi:hypothetical protein
MTKLLKPSLFAGLYLSCSVALAICPNWSATKVGSLDTRLIDEASGLTASVLQKDKLIWSNDSGNAGELFATARDGKVIRTVRVNGFGNNDWEAVASSPCPSNKAESCLYVGDIGDGIGWTSSFKIGIFKEADFWSKTSISPEKTVGYSASMNAEAMIVTAEGKIIVFSKNESGKTQIVMVDSITGKATNAGTLDLNPLIAGARGKGPRITDASLSPEGDKVLILTYGDILEISMDVLNRTLSSKDWRKGIDFNVIKGPALPQQETLTYFNSDKEFIVSTESPDGDVPPVVLYSCKN